ncbi:MAG: isoprenoid biosynthesis glyoxalase ElbB [Verrucomicrobiota bacterium]|nr:isoprenoid biosynthesis glyoxalase ElbB [Verrucomicrobiota bacterium]
MTKVGVLLSGCGVFDGAEIHESVLTLLSLDRAGASVVLCAPNVAQLHVVNHLTGKPAEGESRNVLVEAARIARGVIEDVSTIDARELDALILPGGFGAAKNLSNFAVSDGNFTVNADAAKLIRGMRALERPIGFICIAPVIAAKLFGAEKVEVTVGNDAGTVAAITQCGARHFECAVTDIHIDPVRKVVSTPAYMYDTRISEVAVGIDKLVRAVLDLA